MKKNFHKTFLLVAVVILTNDVKVDAQSTTTPNTYAANRFLGWGTTSGNLEFRVNNSTKMVLQNTTGNFGIGITSPTSVLHTVASGAKTANYTGNLFINTATSSTASVKKYGVDIQSTGTWNGNSAQNVGLNVNVTGGATNYAGLFNGGNVGVGTTTPGTPFQVKTGSFGYGFTQTDGITTVGSYIGNLGGLTGGGWYGTQTNHPLYFFTNDQNPQITLAVNGSVGIGTTTPDPAYKLSVVGDIRAKKLVVEIGWSDYVFDTNYNLMPLNELEKFISVNKHLPNIPSGCEIEDNGLDVGKVQAKQMEKIEELTLYIIEMNKKMQEQNMHIKEQSQRILELEKTAEKR